MFMHVIFFYVKLSNIKKSIPYFIFLFFKQIATKSNSKDQVIKITKFCIL